SLPSTIDTIVSGRSRTLQLSVPAQPEDTIECADDRPVARAPAVSGEAAMRAPSAPHNETLQGTQDFARQP
ncbi:MAG: hypothetical protein JSU68_07405, partial [Phycisphaerales bacterium]